MNGVSQYVTFDRQFATRVLVPAWTAAQGKTCEYVTGFSASAGAWSTIANWFWGPNNPDVLIQLVRTATSGGLVLDWHRADQKVRLIDCTIKHDVHNTSNARIKVIGYLCRVRKNLPRLDTAGSPSGIFSNVTNILATGFRENGIGSGSAGGAQNYAPQFNPFDSKTFCQVFEILKIKTRVIQAGQKAEWKITHNGNYWFDPTELQPTTVTTNDWNDIDVMAHAVSFDHLKGEKFWLFKLACDTIGEGKDTETGKAQMRELECWIATEAKWQIRRSETTTSVYNTEYGIASAQGFEAMGTTEIINPETDTKIDVVNL